MIQLVLWALALERTVWHMPRYHRTTPPRRVLLTLQISWLPPFTNERVQSRIEGARTLQGGATGSADERPDARTPVSVALHDCPGRLAVD
jgi:hypothetical protein